MKLTDKVFYGGMEKKMEYILLMLCSLCSINTYFLLDEGENTVSETLQIIIALLTVISTLTGVIITIHKNTKETNKKIDDLNIGKFKDRTLCNYLYNSIGKGKDDKTLTGQHKDLEQLISKDFEIIAKRYEDEDIVYRNFTQQQKDLKTTLDNFSRDYYEHIKNEHILYDKCTQLELQNEKLTNENLELKQIIAKQKKLLKSQSDKKRSRDITDL